MEIIDADSATGDQNQISTQEHQLAIEHCMKYLVHACKCKDGDCKFRDCQRMKKVVQHSKRCGRQRTTGGCPICKQLVALCCFHAQHCQEAGVCPIPFCINIKNKLKTQQLRKRLQQAQMLRRHIAARLQQAQQIFRRDVTFMQNRRMSGGLLEPNPENSNSSSQPSSGAQPHPSAHSQSDTGMNPSSGPPIGALLAVQQVQAAAARQIAQAQIQNPMSLMMAGIPDYMLNAGNVASWGNSRYAQNHQPNQNDRPLPNPLSLQQALQILGRPNSVSSSIDSTMGPSQVMQNPGPSVDEMQRSTQDWQQLFQTLKISGTSSPPPQNPSYPEN